MQSDISAIVCCYTPERWADLVKAIVSLQRQDCAPRELIVVVDHHPVLLARVRAEFQEITAIENQHRQGLSGARNSGIAAARGGVIAFLDDDAIAADDWLAHLSAALVDPEVLGVGGAVDPAWDHAPPRWFPSEFHWIVGCTYRGLPRRTVAVRNLFGGCFCARREVFEEVGGFREGLGRIGTQPFGGEETEFCIRASQRWPTHRFLYEPRARITHRVTPERARWRYFRRRCYAEGRSKAAIAQLVGARDGLSAERAYTLRTIPRGVARGLADALIHRDLTGLARAAAIVSGLLFTTAGYIAGRAGRPQAVEAIARTSDRTVISTAITNAWDAAELTRGER